MDRSVIATSTNVTLLGTKYGEKEERPGFNIHHHFQVFQASVCRFNCKCE